MAIDRILLSDNGTLDDFSRQVAKYKSGSKSFSYVAAEDAIYIGANVPFNHLYFKMGTTVNALASEIQIKYYNGTEFVSAVNIIDETDVAGASLAQSGFVTWTTDKQEKWHREDTRDQSQQIIDELGSVTIYDKYWLEIKFSADLTASVELEWLGMLFSDDDDLGAEYPDLTRSTVLQAFGGVSKTSWQEQHARAAELIVEDLIKLRVIEQKGQIIDRDTFRTASVSKVAEIIYRARGDDYIDDRVEARNEYQARLNKVIYNVDKDKDGRLDIQEQTQQTGWLGR